jgi:subtilisin family serine protease
MKRRHPVLATLALAVVSLALAGAAAGGKTGDGPKDYIVVYKDAVADVPGKTSKLEEKHKFGKKDEFTDALKGFAATLTEAQASALAADPDVDYLAPDRAVHADVMTALRTNEVVPPALKRIGAATSTLAHGVSTITVAVLDTGIASHRDLNLGLGKNCVNPALKAYDDNGHGTHVAGTIGAKNAGSGVVGVAPGTKVYAVKVLDAYGSGTWSQVICGIDWVVANAARNKIKVVNMSLSGPGANDGNCGNTSGDPLHQAICRATAAGVTFVAAAGNSGVDFSTSVPAAYPEVLTVTATADTDGQAGGLGAASSCGISVPDDTAAYFSNFAVSPEDAAHTIAAPGVCILSTWLAGGWATVSGTSQAAPHVAGTVALCIGNGGKVGPCYGLTPAQIVQKVRADAALQVANVPGYGFSGDTRRYGDLAWAGGY